MLALLTTRLVAADEIKSLEIRPGNLAQVLVEFGQQTGISIVFGQEAVAAYDSFAIGSDPNTGTIDPAAALAGLLKGTCLTPEWIRPTLVAIKPGCNPALVSVPVSSEILYKIHELAEPFFTEEVLVTERRITGTRIASAGIRTPLPVQIIARPEIELSGHQSLSHVLRYTTAVTGNSTSTLVTNGGDGSASVTLRGLPASNTLVLLNGRRLNPDAFAGHAVDLNSLPLAMIDRIEIVKDGASAVYGSDAVAGVVNVRTRRDQDAAFGEIYVGRAHEDGLDTEHASLGIGHQGERWQTFAAGSWYEQGPLYSRERELSRSSDKRTRGGTDGRSSATVPAWIDFGQGPVVLADNGFDGTEAGHFRPIIAEDRFEYRDFTALILPSRRASAFVDATWEWQDNLSFFIEGLATDYVVTNQLAPTPLFTGFERIPISIDADQPFNPFDKTVDDLRRRLVEFGPRKQRNKSRNRRVVTGVSGNFASFHWDFSGQYARTSASELFHGVVDASLVTDALRPDCFSPCVPLNLFGPAGSITEQMLAYVSSPTRSHGTSRMRGFTFNLEGSVLALPAGNVELATGAEFREEKLITRPDGLIQEGRIVGSTNFTPTKGRRSVWEAYLKLDSPFSGVTLCWADWTPILQFAVRFMMTFVPRPIRGWCCDGSQWSALACAPVGQKDFGHPI